MRNLWVYFNNSESDLNIDECGIQTYDKFEIYQYKVLQNFVLHLVMDGEGFFEINGQKYPLNKGEGYIIRNSDNVLYYPKANNPWTTYWIGLKGDKLEEYLNGTLLKNEHVIKFHPNGKTQEVIKNICETTQMNESNLPDEFWYKSQLYLLFNYIKKEFSVKNNTNSLTSKELAEVAYHYIYTNYMNEISIEEVAEYLAVSRSYLYKLFKKKYDFSPQQFLLDRRLTVAASMLLTTDDTISTISQKVSFHDPLYFSKSFSNYYDLSPSKFREQHDYDSYLESWEKFGD